MSGNFLMINGKILRVINSTVEVEDGDRIRWSIVTEEMMPDQVTRMMYEAISTAGVPSTAQDPFSVMADVKMSAVRQPSGFDAFMAMRYASAAAEVQPAAPADATAALSIEDCPGGESCPGHATAACAKCRKPFDPADQSYAGRAQFPQTPFCCGCISRCHDSEIADHWCAVDEWREKDGKPQELFRNSGPAAPRPLLDGPPSVTAARKPPERCGDDCAGCGYCAPRRQ